MENIFPSEQPDTYQPVFPSGQLVVEPKNLEEVATQAALVESSHNGVPLPEQIPVSTQNIQTIGLDEVRRSIAEQEKQIAQRAAEYQLKKTPSGDTAAYYQEILKQNATPPDYTAMEQAAVDIVTPTNAINFYTNFNRKSNATDLAARNILYENYATNIEAASFWDKVLVFGRTIIPFANSRAMAKSVAEALNKDTEWGDVFNPNAIVNEFRNAYLFADENKKKNLVQALIHGLDKYSRFFGDKNAAQVASHMNQVLEGTRAGAIESTLFDVAGLPLLTTARLLVKGARTAAELGKPAVVAARAGNTDLATNLMASDAIKGTHLSGMDSQEIARSAVSMNMTPLEFEFQNLKMGQTLQEKLRTFALDIRGRVQNTLSSIKLNEGQVQASKEYYNELYSSARNRAIYEYTPTRFEGGLFTGEIKWQSADGIPFLTKAAAEGFGFQSGKQGEAIRILQPGEIPQVFRSNRWEPALREHQEALGAGEVSTLPKEYQPKQLTSIADGVTKEYIKPEPFLNPDLLGKVFADKDGLYVLKQNSKTYGVEDKGSWVFAENISNPLPLEKAGSFSMADISGRNWWNWGIPALRSSVEVLSNRGLGRSAQAKIGNDFKRAYKESIKGVDAEQQSLVTKALVEGDAFSNQGGALGHVWDSVELESKGLNNKGIEAYYKQRLLRDTMWLMRNRQMVQEFKAGGFVEMAFDGNDFLSQLHSVVKPLPVGSAKSLLAQNKIGRVMDSKTGDMTLLTPEHVDEIYVHGGQVVRFYKEEDIGGRQYSHMIAYGDNTTFREAVAPLPYRPGEFSRVYADEYFVTLKYKIRDEFDNSVGQTRTIRTAKNTQEAEAFADAHQMALKLALSTELDRATRLKAIEPYIGKYTNPESFLAEVESGKIPADTIFDFHYNRETHSYLQDTIDEAITNGRLFYSRRGEKLLSVDATRENTLDVSSSLGIELANVARFITSKDIRVDAIEKWMNTFGAGVANKTYNKVMDFSYGNLNADLIKQNLLSEGSELAKIPSDELLKFAESTRDYIRQQLRIRTPEQKLNQTRYQRTVEWLEGTKLGKMLPESFGPAMRQMNVADALRSINFNITLALGNPSQLLVQANGMMIAAATHPFHGFGAAKMAIPLRLALMSDNPNVWKTFGTIDSLTSLGLKNVNEFVDIVKAVKKSGILDDIRSTVMYNVEDGALDLYKGYAKEAFKEASPWFFNRGEEFSRLVSWEVSRREWVAKNPGKAWQEEEGLQAISIRQKEYNLGMQAHNTAAWQQGWAGIPMQFLQYNIKLAAALTHTTAQFRKDIGDRGWKALTNFDNGNYRQFDPAQALALLGSQIILYGAAGNGLRNVANSIWGEGDTAMSEEKKMYLSEGLSGGLLYTLTKQMDEHGVETGAKVALGKRLGSFEWYGTIYDKIVHDKTDVTDFLFGATKSTGVKGIDVVKNLARLFYYGEVTPELVMSQLAKAPEVIASWSNAVKAYQYMQNEGYVTSKDGTPITRINTKENLAALLGFSSVAVQEYYENLKDEKYFMNQMSELAKTIHSLQLQQWEATKQGNDKLANDLEQLRFVMMPRDLTHRSIINRMLKEKLWPGDTASDKVRRQFQEQMHQEIEKFRVLDKPNTGIGSKQ